MPVVYEETEGKRFRAPWVSLATLFHVLTVLALVIGTFFVAFATPNFWPHSASYQEQPSIEFKRQLITHFTTTTTSTSAITHHSWSTSPGLNNRYFLSSTRVPQVTHSRRDWDSDGRADELHTAISFPLMTTETLTSFQVLALYQCSLSKRASVEMEGHVWLDEGSSIPTGSTGLFMFSQATIHQARPFTQPPYSKLEYNTSVFDDSSIHSVEDLRLSTLVGRITARNDTMELLSPVHKVWDYAPNSGGVFSVRIVVRVPEQTVHYVPGFAETMKFGWVQYVAVWWFMWIFFKAIRWLVFSHGLLTTWPSATKGISKKLL